MARGKAVAIDLSATERGELDGLLRRHGTAQALALRARIVLRAADGLTNSALAAGLGIDQPLLYHAVYAAAEDRAAKHDEEHRHARVLATAGRASRAQAERCHVAKAQAVNRRANRRRESLAFVRVDGPAAIASVSESPRGCAEGSHWSVPSAQLYGQTRLPVEAR
jgi:DNA-binding CsgD family transcriptional regulator